jgi:FkbM family methyltransferase
MKRLFKRSLHRLGLDLRRYTAQNSASLRRMYFVIQENIDTILDIGANAGQYAAELRESGFAGRIVSCEPQAGAYQALCRRAVRDALWTCKRLALGAEPGEAVLHLSGNSVSSSLLPMTPYMAAAFADAACMGTETVPVATLDSLVRDLKLEPAKFFLKLDVQGYEQQALHGAGSLLTHTPLIEAELALVPMYDHGSNFPDVFEFLTQLGYRLVSLEANTIDPRTQHVVEVNAIFTRV